MDNKKIYIDTTNKKIISSYEKVLKILETEDCKIYEVDKTIFMQIYKIYKNFNNAIEKSFFQYRIQNNKQNYCKLIY